MAVIVMAAPAPARADPATPTNYLSEVTGIEPPTERLRAEILGGDAFLAVEVDPGTEVVVLGYEGEPYLRIDPEGVVWINTLSPAYYLNDDRFAQIDVPPSADADATPEWTQVGDSGEYGWHDHRTHWMAPEPPIGVDQGAVTHIQDWVVPIEVDGAPVGIEGQLKWQPTLSPFPWVALAVIASAALALVSRNQRLAATLMIVGGLSALVVGLAQTLTSPLGLADEALAWVPGVLILVVGLVSIWRPPSLAVIGGSAVVLGTWCVPRLATLWMPVLPTGLPEWAERSAVVLATACAIGLGATVLRSLRGVTSPGQTAD